MPFDIATAKPVRKFDLATAKPVESASEQKTRTGSPIGNTMPLANTHAFNDTYNAVKGWPGAIANAYKGMLPKDSSPTEIARSFQRFNPMSVQGLAGMANMVSSMAQAPINLLSPDASKPMVTLPQFEAGKPASDVAGAVMSPVGGLIGGTSKDVGGATGVNPDRIEAGINTALLAAPFIKAKPKAPKPNIPTKEQLGRQSAAAYKAAEDAGIQVSGDSFAKVKQSIVSDLKQIDPTLHPDTTAALKRVVETEGPVTLEQLETLRRIAQDAESSIKPADGRLAGQIVDHIDDYVEGLGQSDVISGNAANASILKDARNLWSRKKKADVIDELMRRAELSAPNFSASGMENAVRTEFRALAKNQRKLRGFTPEEKAAIEKVAKGGPLENSLRMLGKLSPEGAVSIMANLGAAAATGGASLGVTGAGFAARRGATAMTMRNAERANELMRRGPIQQPQAAPIAQPIAQGIAGELMPRTPLGLPAPSMIAGQRSSPGTAYARETMGLTPDIERAGVAHPSAPRDAIPRQAPPLPALPNRPPMQAITDQRPMIVDQAGRVARTQQDLSGYMNDLGLSARSNARQPGMNPTAESLTALVERSKAAESPAIKQKKPAKMTEVQKLESEAKQKGFFEKENPTREQIAAEREWSLRYKLAKDRAKSEP